MHISFNWRKACFGDDSISYLIHDIETVRIHRRKFHHPYSLPCWFLVIVLNFKLFFLCNIGITIHVQSSYLTRCIYILDTETILLINYYLVLTYFPRGISCAQMEEQYLLIKTSFTHFGLSISKSIINNFFSIWPINTSIFYSFLTALRFWRATAFLLLWLLKTKIRKIDFFEVSVSRYSRPKTKKTLHQNFRNTFVCMCINVKF